MTEFLAIDGRRLAYDVAGDGPLVVLAHGMGDNRSAFGAVAERLVAAGYRVASVDQRGHGESSTGWASYTRSDSADDLLAVVDHLGGPAVLVGHSFAGGAATIAAAREPASVDAVVEISPFTRRQTIEIGALFAHARYRKGLFLLMGATLLRNVGLWRRYLVHAHPGTTPSDLSGRLAAIETDLRRPGRMAVVSAMAAVAPTDADAHLGGIACPALVLEGALDPDWADARAEGEKIVAAMPPGLGGLEVIEATGHYPHVQSPHEVTAAILNFLGARLGR